VTSNASGALAMRRNLVRMGNPASVDEGPRA
jgi:hypothetical protein